MRSQRNTIPRSWDALSVGLSTLCALTAAQQVFLPVATGAAAVLDRRQTTGCLANFYSCATEGAIFSNICCQYGQICTTDAASNPACCPAG